MRIPYTLALLPFCLAPAHAQLYYDFEDGILALWGIEGDGWIVLEENNGNPGNSLRVNEPAAGLINYVIAPPALSGDWSAATASDHFRLDLYLHSFGGPYLQNMPYLVQLRGPGGVANAIPNYNPATGQWHEIEIPLNIDNWTMESGNFVDLLAEVELVRIRAEFITGNEYVLLDNVGTSFTPVPLPIPDPLCSTFDAGQLFDGWNFQNVASAAINPDMGNPPPCVQIGDQPNVLSAAYAPPKFLGDLSAWNMVGEISLDTRVNTSLSTPQSPDHFIRLSGPGGEAKVYISVDEILEATNAWRTFVYPLEEEIWDVTDGTWQGLLAMVTEIEVMPEYYFGTAETVFMDNFCIGTRRDLSAGARPSHRPSPFAFPNPTAGPLHLHGLEERPWPYVLLDASGREVAQGSWRPGMPLDLAGLHSGLYILWLPELDARLRVIRE